MASGNSELADARELASYPRGRFAVELLPNTLQTQLPHLEALRVVALWLSCDATRLSTDRYRGGLDSYLQVLDAQRNLFRSELDLATLQRQELTAIVELYRALGGGWRE